MSPDRYALARTVLAELPCPVVIVAAAHAGERSCATGTAMYVSFVPAALAIALHPGSNTCRLVEASGAFSISLLSDSQFAAADVGGRSLPVGDKLEALGLEIATSEHSPAPGLAGVPLTVWCDVTQRHTTGDHWLFIGTIVDSNLAEEDIAPLLRQRRRYAGRGAWLSEERPGYPT